MKRSRKIKISRGLPRGFLLVLMLLACCLAACTDQSSDQSSKKEKIVLAKIQKPTQRLYYSGVLAPLSMQSVLSPVAGQVVNLNFSYGQFVKKNQLLLSIDSIDLTQDYRKSIADYLQKKSAYSNSLEEFRGSQALYKAGVISREEFINSRSQYRTNQLNYYQSRYHMEKILLKANINPKDVEQLTIEDASQVNQLLQRQLKHILVHAVADGIVLFPVDSSDSSGGNNTKQLVLGTSVKQGELLLTIGDLTGLSTRIYVNEINIDRIHLGMAAIVTVNAFPNLKLKGYVASVSSQAKTSSQGDGLSEFPVWIKIPKITNKQRRMIRVGMTAKIMLLIHKHPTILLPINSVFKKNDQSMVTIVTKLGRRKTVPVICGFTTSTEVSIVDGVKPGDRVVVPGSQ